MIIYYYYVKRNLIFNVTSHRSNMTLKELSTKSSSQPFVNALEH